MTTTDTPVFDQLVEETTSLAPETEQVEAGETEGSDSETADDAEQADGAPSGE